MSNYVIIILEKITAIRAYNFSPQNFDFQSMAISKS